MAEYPDSSSIQNPQMQYPPSWIDRFIVWIDHFPGSAWLFYTLSILFFAVFINAIFWIDGSMPFGSFDPINTGFSIFVVYWIGLYHYLSGVGARSLKIFSPLLEAEEGEILILNHELTILPRWIGLVAILLGFGLAAAMVFEDPAPYGDIVPQTMLPFIGDVIIMGFLLSTFLCLTIRSVRQLRMVRKLHARATNINLLKLDPAHAFSGLTSRTGIGIILVLVFSLPLDSTPLSSSFDIFLFAMTSILAILVFELPVIGIRNQLEKKKQSVLTEINDLLQATSDRLHDRIRTDHYQSIGDAKDALEALIRERELIEKISTWPWDSSTLRVFGSALLLPIFLHLVTRLLEEILSL